MGKGSPGHGAVHIDEKYLIEWFENGYRALVEYLANHARLDAWCAEHNQQQGEP